MTHQIHHSAPEAAAMTFLLTLAGLVFVAVSILASGSPLLGCLPLIASEGTHIGNLVPAVTTVLFLGFLAGVVGWLALPVIHSDGKHRLESLLNGSR